MSLVSIVGLNKAEGCREKRRRKRDREAEMRPVERGFISEQVSTILAPPQPLLKKRLAVSCFFFFFFPLSLSLLRKSSYRSGTPAICPVAITKA